MTGRWARLVLAASVVTLLAATGAPAASHELTAAHQPQPFAIRGEDLTLEIGVASTCSPFCSSIIIEAHYIDQFGRPATVAAATPEHLPIAGATLTIPGGAVLGPTFDYWFTATQMRCVFGYDCQTATTTSPRGGVHTVPVTVG